MPKSWFCNTIAETNAIIGPEIRIAIHEKQRPKTRPTIALIASRAKMAFMTIRASLSVREFKVDAVIGCHNVNRQLSKLTCAPGAD
jgi:hypothetical protein